MLKKFIIQINHKIREFQIDSKGMSTRKLNDYVFECCHSFLDEFNPNEPSLKVTFITDDGRSTCSCSVVKYLYDGVS
jgi:hypothetical protein